MTSKNYSADITTIRAQARENLAEGAVTSGYKADRLAVVEMLNAALATELVCVLRYQNHYYLASGLNAQAAASEFLEHARQEQEHAGQLAERIVQLGGKPGFAPENLIERSHAEYVEGGNLDEMIRENLVAERIAIDSYRSMIDFLGDDDPTTTGMLEDILAVEEEHADDLAGLMSVSSVSAG